VQHRLRSLLAWILVLSCVAVLQTELLSAPIGLSPQLTGGDASNALIGYRVQPRSVAVGEPVNVTLFFRRPVAPATEIDVGLVSTADAAHPDPVVRPAFRPILDAHGTAVRVRLIPGVPPGTWKLRVGGGRPFGLLRVTS
jgi:hypothetical protein